MIPCSHSLDDGLPDPWAVEWGEDRFGPFMSFAVGDVVQRMRWVTPGKFLMGSPKSEAGRYDDESPQHPVEVRQGFWLADTPCTQALWQAIMGENPSEFIDPDRPVEQVSWDDCQVFLTRLDALFPGFGARLPTEAEWEYACRCGTTGATWMGDLDLRGENDAPRLDAIAWYGGNSGQGFDLSNGRNSNKWPEKQYPHTLAGTMPVRLKLPNLLCLYDMLGNVFEWCEDWFGPYDRRPAVDSHGPVTGSYRVVRGGSWDSIARYIRAAYRIAEDPASRSVNVGFRLARGLAPSLRVERPTPGERIRRP